MVALLGSSFAFVTSSWVGDKQIAVNFKASMTLWYVHYATELSHSRSFGIWICSLTKCIF